MLILVLIIILVLILFNNNNNYEHFKPKIHAVVDGKCGVKWFSFQSPRSDGVDGCASVPCPTFLEDNYVCWNCCNYR